MTMTKPSKKLMPLIECLRARGYINIRSSDKSISTLEQGIETHFGPLGTFMRHKIKAQWWDVMVHKQSNVFPVESIPLGHLNPGGNKNGNCASVSEEKERLQLDCLSSYPEVLKLTNGQLPFSIASVGSCKACEVENNSAEREFFLGSSNRSLLLLQNYTAPTGSSRVLDYWLQLRLSWWKKYSRNPAHFHVVASSNNHNGNSKHDNEERNNNFASLENRLAITYEFPWGTEVVEEVANVGDSMVKQLPEDQRFRSKTQTRGKKEILPHCIQCSTSVEVAMAAWLIDAYHDRNPVATSKRQIKSNKNLVLHLHSEIAPYQVAIARDLASSSSDDSEELSHITVVAERLTTDLQQEGVTVFNASTHGASLLAHFKRNDQLGVPYTVILNTETLNSGVISIRNRDTELQEETHISSTAQKLRKYLTSELE